MKRFAAITCDRSTTKLSSDSNCVIKTLCYIQSYVFMICNMFSGCECAELVTDTTYSTSSGVQPLSVQNTVIVFSSTSLFSNNGAFRSVIEKQVYTL